MNKKVYIGVLNGKIHLLKNRIFVYEKEIEKIQNECEHEYGEDYEEVGYERTYTCTICGYSTTH